MRTNIKPENRRLLEALDYLDESVISSVLAEVSVPESGAPEVGKRSVKRSMKYVLALAACLVLLGTVMPMLTHLMGAYPEWFGLAGAGPIGENDEYILTEGDLAAINAAWIERRGTIFAPTVESAMRRTASDGHYFGKYGETIVIWINSSEQVTKYFTLGGHDFKFISGWLCFFNGGKVYDHDEIADADILTDRQIDAVYSYYKNKYLTLDFENALSYWEFIPTLESLTEAQMRAASDAVAKYRSEIEYEREYPFGLVFGDAEDYANRAAQYSLERDRDIMFRGNILYERYYGTVGGCIIMATESIETWQHENAVEGIVIDDNITFTPFAYLDGEVLELKDAYEAGWLTVDDIVKIASRHQLYEAQLKPTEYLLSGSYLDPIKELEPLSAADFTGNGINRGIKASDRYLGCFNGYYVILDTASDATGGYIPDGINTVKVGGYEFRTGEWIKLRAYKDGEWHELSEVYRAGNITDAQLYAIYSRNNEYQKYFDPDAITTDKRAITEDTLALINEAFEKRFGAGQRYAESLSKTYSIENYCFGRMRDIIVFRSQRVFDPDVHSFEIDGVRFSEASPPEFWVYREGELYSIEDAYALGLLTKNELKYIAAISSEV